jgi:FtsZ-binding cell division protein ZapB
MKAIINFILELLGFKTKTKDEKELIKKEEKLQEEADDLRDQREKLKIDDKTLEQELKYWENEGE